MRKKIVAGNWKMNNDLQEGLKLTSEIVNMVDDEVRNESITILIPPFIHLSQIAKLIDGNKQLLLGAQNCSEYRDGAYTGEISARMLKSVGVSYVIVGHSERRAYFKETSQQLSEKVNLILHEGMTPIFCCGETLEERNASKHVEIVKNQIKEGLFHLDAEAIKNMVIAYEPVWAIGTGVTATTAQAQEMHEMIRSFLLEKYNEKIAEDISILYGGSVKPSNAEELFLCNDIDGGLIGGASLQSRDFLKIIKSI